MNETLRIDFLLKEVNSKLIFVMNEDISTEKVSQSSSEKSLRIQKDDKLSFNKHVDKIKICSSSSNQLCTFQAKRLYRTTGIKRVSDYMYYYTINF